jgi:hypothetical protein
MAHKRYTQALRFLHRDPEPAFQNYGISFKPFRKQHSRQIYEADQDGGAKADSRDDAQWLPGQWCVSVTRGGHEVAKAYQ